MPTTFSHLNHVVSESVNIWREIKEMSTRLLNQNASIKTVSFRYLGNVILREGFIFLCNFPHKTDYKIQAKTTVWTLLTLLRFDLNCNEILVKEWKWKSDYKLLMNCYDNASNLHKLPVNFIVNLQWNTVLKYIKIGIYP